MLIKLLVAKIDELLLHWRVEWNVRASAS